MDPSSLSSAQRADLHKTVIDCQQKVWDLRDRRRFLELNLERIQNEIAQTEKEIAETEANRIQALSRLGFTESSSEAETVNGTNSASSSTGHQVQHTCANNFELVTHIQSVDLGTTAGDLESNSQLHEITSVSFKTNHKFKIRSIEFLGSNTNQFITSGDDGWIQKWELKSSTDATHVLKFNAMVGGKFPFDVAVSPAEESVVAVYRHNKKLKVYSLCSQEELGNMKRDEEIEETPHKEGLAQVAFMPWRNNGHPVFATGGALGHEIVAWGRVGLKWRKTAMHNVHTNSVTGICGHISEFKIISVGRDGRIVLFDLEEEKEAGEDQMNVGCAGVAANPVDRNMLCVQTSEDGGQLMLRDMRYKREEVATFGWHKAKEDGRYANSNLVAPAWHREGLLLSAGSGGKEVKIFDIRYHQQQIPVSCEKTSHAGPVLMVAWAPTREVLLSTGEREIRLHGLGGG